MTTEAQDAGLEADTGLEIVVARDGSIPADELAPRGILPGMRLRVFPEKVPEKTAPPTPEKPFRSLYGSLPDLPHLTWEEFEGGSRHCVRPW
jgi:hypothetical protein